MNIVIPSAGCGARMNSDIPKAFIAVKEKPLIEWAFSPLKELGARVIIIALAEEAEYYRALDFWHEIIYTDKITDGPACSVMLAEAFIDNAEPLIIVNNDQYVNFNAREWIANSAPDGSIVTCEQSEEKYSYALTDYHGMVTLTAEKRVIAPNAMLGYNYYRRGSDFCAGYREMVEANDRTNGEFYTAPVYNYMIRNGAAVNIFDIPVSDFYNFGTVEELEKSRRRLCE